MEKTQSLIPPYTCHGLCALCYGWSAAVPWSRLFLLRTHGLRARRYGLWAGQGQERSTELIARTPLILRISPSYFDNRRAVHVQLFSVYGEDPVSDLSLHVLRAPRSTLWVVGYGSLVVPVPPTRAWALRLMLWTMG